MKSLSIFLTLFILSIVPLNAFALPIQEQNVMFVKGSLTVATAKIKSYDVRRRQKNGWITVCQETNAIVIDDSTAETMPDGLCPIESKP